MSDYDIELDKSDIEELMEHGHIKAMDDGVCICISLKDFGRQVDYKDIRIELIDEDINCIVNGIPVQTIRDMRRISIALKKDKYTECKPIHLEEELKNAINNRNDALDEVAKLREENKGLKFVCEGHANTIRRLLEVDWKKSYHALSERVEELRDENDDLKDKIKELQKNGALQEKNNVDIENCSKTVEKLLHDDQILRDKIKSMEERVCVANIMDKDICRLKSMHDYYKELLRYELEEEIESIKDRKSWKDYIIRE